MLVNKRIPENIGTVEKVQMLAKSISEVSKYELLTTNQYLDQMKIVIELFKDISKKVN